MKKHALLLALALLTGAIVTPLAAASHGPAPSSSHCATQAIAAEAICLTNWAADWSVWLALAYAEIDWVGLTFDLTFALLGIVLDPAFCAVFEEPLIRVANCI